MFLEDGYVLLQAIWAAPVRWAALLMGNPLTPRWSMYEMRVIRPESRFSIQNASAVLLLSPIRLNFLIEKFISIHRTSSYFGSMLVRCVLGKTSRGETMPQNRKHRLWMLLLIPFLCLLLYLFVRPNQKLTKIPAHPDESSINAEEKAAPSNSSVDIPTVPFSAPRYSPFKWKTPTAPSNATQSMEWTMTGTVKSDEGQPLPGATVSLYPYGPQIPDWRWPEPLLTEICDQNGRYTIT